MAPTTVPVLVKHSLRARPGPTQRFSHLSRPADLWVAINVTLRQGGQAEVQRQTATCSVSHSERKEIGSRFADLPSLCSLRPFMVRAAKWGFAEGDDTVPSGALSLHLLRLREESSLETGLAEVTF